MAAGPRYKPLSVGVVLLDLVPAAQHQPDLFAADNGRRQKLSPLVDRINDRYGRCTIGFGLFAARCARVQGPCRLSPGAGEVGVLSPRGTFTAVRRCHPEGWLVRPGVTILQLLQIQLVSLRHSPARVCWRR